MVDEAETVTKYERADVLRILRITNRQIQGWEKAGILPVSDSYSFFDLLQIKKLRDLRAKHVRSAVILKSLQEMRLAAGMQNPLLESSPLRARLDPSGHHCLPIGIRASQGFQRSHGFRHENVRIGVLEVASDFQLSRCHESPHEV